MDFFNISSIFNNLSSDIPAEAGAASVKEADFFTELPTWPFTSPKENIKKAKYNLFILVL
jgi:hypothetical protein